MSNTTILIIVAIIIVGGIWYGRGRWF